MGLNTLIKTHNTKFYLLIQILIMCKFIITNYTWY